MAYDRRAWTRLLSIIGLPINADEDKETFSEEECVETFDKVIDRLIDLPATDMVSKYC